MCVYLSRIFIDINYTELAKATPANSEVPRRPQNIIDTVGEKI